MARKKKQRKAKSSNIGKAIDRALPGFWMRFVLEDPLGDHDKPNVKVGHSNYVIQIKLANDSYWESMRQVLHHRPLKWKMEIKMEFKKNGKSDFKARELVGIGRLPELDDHYQQTIEDMFQDATDKNYLDQYVETTVFQEVISGRIISDDDFSG